MIRASLPIFERDRLLDLAYTKKARKKRALMRFSQDSIAAANRPETYCLEAVVERVNVTRQLLYPVELVNRIWKKYWILYSISLQIVGEFCDPKEGIKKTLTMSGFL